MRLQNKVLFYFILIWAAFLSIIDIGAHQYLLPKLLYIESGGGQEVILHRYVYQQLFNHYLLVFFFIGLLTAGLMWFVFHKVFVSHLDMLQQLHHTMALEVKKEDALSNKISLLEKQAEKAQKLDVVFHTICDLLNNMSTSLSLIQEKAGENKYLTEEIASLKNHLNQLNQTIKSI